MTDKDKKLKGLAAIKASDPERFATIQQRGAEASKSSWTPERKAAYSARMKALYANKQKTDSQDTPQS